MIVHPAAVLFNADAVLGTGEWLINHELFKAWKATRGSKIWCPGIPGVGKTSMASFVVQTLIELYNSPDAIPTAFVFADFKDKERYQQDQHTIVSTVTRQLASQNPAVMNEAYARYRTHKEHSLGDSVAPLTFAEHLEILKNASSHVDRMFIVIDAVDEIPSTEEVEAKDIRFELLHALTQLEYVSLLCTSRPHIEPSSFSSNFSTLPIEATDKDLRTFLEAEILSSRRLSNVVGRDSSLKEEIVRNITQKASGVFLLARFQIKEVKTAMSPRQVRSALGKLSGKLKDMYVQCWYADIMIADMVRRH
jgi:Cdc6-like AAA superfamily ATPase